jgi:ubiquinone/menaquinone biosynthesis C-methylase UbiE
MKQEPTTERLTAENQMTNEEGYLLYLVHLATYKYCIPAVTGKRVLDYGCGTGYGTSLISEYCNKAIGVDISTEAIQYAQSHFSASNLQFMQIEPVEAALLPFPNSSFDVVLSFQVIEHLRDVPAYLQEIERVLAPEGQVFIATPDRSSRLFSFQKPWNIWHLREYSREQLYNTLAVHFSDVQVLQTGGEPDILRTELKRTVKLKWLTLPFTLPFIPDSARKACLRAIKNARYSMTSYSRNSFTPKYDDRVITISEHEKFSVDLVAIAQKKAAPRT